jgi:hypothetical protein
MISTRNRRKKSTPKSTDWNSVLELSSIIPASVVDVIDFTKFV